MNVPINVPHREMYWHISSPYKYFIYPLMVISLGIFAYGVYKKVKFWSEGQPNSKRFGDWWKRIKMVMWEIPFQPKVLKDAYGGFIHVLIFWSFCLLILATAVVFVDVDFGLPIFQGKLYLAISLMADIAGVALFAGLVFAAIRRYVQKPDKLDNRWDDAFVLVLLGLAVITGFLLEGIRMRYAGDKWAMWSPVGYIFSLGVGGMSDTVAKRVFQTTWWLHFAVTFTFFAAIPYTKFFHIITMPLNVFFSSLEPKGSSERVDIEAMMEDEEAFENFNVGVSAIKDTTWKQRLDYDSCIRCGRCMEVCPAFNNDHPLNPKDVINNIKTMAQKNLQVGPEEEPPLIVGNAVESDSLWECRTCRACMEVCPAHIEHVPQIIELRRAEVMMRGQLPQDGSIALKQMEKTGNPFGPQHERSNWIKDDNIPVIGPGEECEMLFWIGCCTTYDPIKRKVAHNVLQILKHVGVDVAVLGDDELCCGDPARLFGDENLFQATVKNQIELIKTRKFKSIICHCPHCYNALKNEYPQFGGNFNILHHTEVIYQLIKEGKIKLELPIEQKITYHDPCYLGRYNDVYEEPREIIKSIKGVQLVEMAHNREKAQCCGGGGGHFWMDIMHGERLNVTRIKEAVDTKASIVATSCIYCLQMLDDAIKILDLDEQMRAEDISELVIEAMGGLANAQMKDANDDIAA